MGKLEDEIQKRQREAGLEMDENVRDRRPDMRFEKGVEIDPDAFILPVKTIVVEEQARKTFEGIDDLARKIKSEGQLQPIVVERLESGRYLLVAGERRLRAIRDVLKWDTIRASLKGETLDAVERRYVQLIENTQREDYKPLELAEEILKLRNETGASDAALGERLGRNRSWVYKQCDLAQAPEKIKAAIRAGDLAPTTYLNNKKDYLEDKAVRKTYVKVPFNVSLKMAQLLQAIASKSTSADPIKLKKKPTKKEILTILEERADELIEYFEEKNF